MRAHPDSAFGEISVHTLKLDFVRVDPLDSTARSLHRRGLRPAVHIGVPSYVLTEVSVAKGPEEITEGRALMSHRG